MANFQFPNPNDQTTVINPETGATYQWKADPGKWVLTGEAPEEIKELNIPFVNSYRLVNPDNFIGESGTATLETDAYADGNDSYLSPVVEIARFAPLDLNGRKHEAVETGDSFELSPTEYNSDEVSSFAYGKFKVTSRVGYSEYSVDFDNGRAFKFIEGDTIYYRPSSANDYVSKTGGDSMEGPLTVTGPRIAGGDGLESTVKTLNVDSGENSDLQLKRNGTTGIYIGDGINNYMGSIKFGTPNAQLFGATDIEIGYFGADALYYKGVINDPKAVTNKEYVDERDDLLRQDIEEDQERQDVALQDEIDARVQRDSLHDAEIDTLEFKLDALLGLTFRGTYEFKHEADCDAAYLTCLNNAGDDINAQQDCTRDYASCEQDKVLPGYFEAVDPDDQFDHLEQIIIAKSDASGLEVDWAGVLNAGDYLEVDHVFAGSLDKTNYGLYRIEEEPEVTTNALGQEVYTMKLQFLQGDGVMNEGEKYEIRGITAAEGVNPEELGDFLTKDQAAATYLPLAGGTLTGTLNMKDNAAVKTRHLDSGQNSNLQIKHNGATKVYVGGDKTSFNQDVDLGNNNLERVESISFNTDGFIKHGDNERLKFQSKSTAHAGDGLVVFERPGSHGRRGITIRGLHPDDNKETDILWTYTNASNGDAVNYDGKMTSDTNLVNKKWVDDNKAAKNHSHTNYASSSHSHSDYALKTHSHSNYSSSSHGHGSTYIKSRDSQDIKIYKSGNLYYII